MLTGRLIFRNTTQKSNRAGYKTMVVCGIISVPNDWQGKAEHRYLTTGCVNNDPYTRIHFDTEEDIATELTGMTLDQLVTSPLLRI